MRGGVMESRSNSSPVHFIPLCASILRKDMVEYQDRMWGGDVALLATSRKETKL